jgi:RimJ/RimL family protein N-acetyltransferase
MAQHQSGEDKEAAGSARILLRDVVEGDLELFFEHQSDPAANRMAAFTAKDPADREAFMVKWARLLADPNVLLKTVLYETHVAGHVASYGPPEQREVTYWIAQEFWGRGIATLTLAKFLKFELTRPLHARAAKDNLASLRVLEKCGFAVVGHDQGFANGRDAEVEEFILKLL